MTEAPPTNAPRFIEETAPSFVVQAGIDLGRKRDHSAIAVMEVRRNRAGHSFAAVRQWERLPIGMSWDKQWTRFARSLERVVEKVRENWQEAYTQASLNAMDARVIDPDEGPQIIPPPSPRVRVRVDSTGVGDAIVEEIEKEIHPNYADSIRVYPIYFNHGDRIKYEKGAYSLGKSYMVSMIQAHLAGKRIKVAPGILDAEAALQELEDYEVEITENMNEKYGAFKVGSHDDLVTALGLSLIDLTPPQTALSGIYPPGVLGF